MTRHHLLAGPGLILLPAPSRLPAAQSTLHETPDKPSAPVAKQFEADDRKSLNQDPTIIEKISTPPLWSFQE